MTNDDKGITLSENYDLNPSIGICEICGKETGELLMYGKIMKAGKEVQAPMHVPHGLCKSCQTVINLEGCMIIEVKDGSDQKNPYRTGRIVGINKEGKESLDLGCKVCYMEHTAFDRLFKQTFDKNETGDGSGGSK